MTTIINTLLETEAAATQHIPRDFLRSFYRGIRSGVSIPGISVDIYDEARHGYHTTKEPYSSADKMIQAERRDRYDHHLQPGESTPTLRSATYLAGAGIGALAPVTTTIATGDPVYLVPYALAALDLLNYGEQNADKIYEDLRTGAAHRLKTAFK